MMERLKKQLFRVDELAKVNARADRLQAELAAVRKLFPVVDTESEPAWGEADAQALRQFLRSDTGQKLLATVNYHEQGTNRAAVLRSEGWEHNAGYAKGWHQASIYFFHTLPADVRPKQDDATESGDGAALLRERLAP